MTALRVVSDTEIPSTKTDFVPAPPIEWGLIAVVMLALGELVLAIIGAATVISWL